MIRTQVRCDKRVSFRDRREGWTCVCPSPGVARTHMATRTVSLRAGNPRQAWTRPSPTAPMRWRVLRSTNAGCNHTGLSGGSRPQHQAATTHKRPMLHTPLRHRRTLGKITKPRHHRRRPTISWGRRRGGLRLGAGSFPVALRPRLASTSRRTPSRHLAASARGPAIRYGTCSLGPTGC